MRKKTPRQVMVTDEGSGRRAFGRVGYYRDKLSAGTEEGKGIT